MNDALFLGIDYGARYAGTTAIVWEEEEQFKLSSSVKKEDADKLIRKQITELNPKKIFIDAPLNLPGAYHGKGNDFFYRKADREVEAMSPMFLGGLTARAMQLRNEFPDIEFIESYPKLIVRILQAETYYKQDSVKFINQIQTHFPVTIPKANLSWHEIDAALAWLIGHRFTIGKAVCYGIEEEGLIWG